MRQSGGWLAGLEAEARTRLSEGTYDWVAGGAGLEQTLRRSVQAWRELALLPDAMRDVSAVDLRTTVLGTALAVPLGAAPSGFHGLMHPDGERASASAVAQAGCLFVLSSRCSPKIEEIALAGPTPEAAEALGRMAAFLPDHVTREPTPRPDRSDPYADAPVAGVCGDRHAPLQALCNANR